MHLTFRNVNDAFRGLVDMFRGNHWMTKDAYGHPYYANAKTVRRPSRNGDVLMIPEPVTITYTHPRERVLFNAARDVNPFALLYESLWMLAGRNDVAALSYYTKQFAAYSDDGKTLNGAYGYRWRMATVRYGRSNIQPMKVDGDDVSYPTKLDQLDLLVAHLKADPNSRRAVLQMWNVEDDLLKIGKMPGPIKADGRCDHCGGKGYHEGVGDDHSGGTCGICHGTGIQRNKTVPGLIPASKDVCCNLSVMFSLREVAADYIDAKDRINRGEEPRRTLDMTVTNRSNDLVWGLLGANYVTFSVLQEYLASRLGVEVGLYHHFTNNLHVYTEGQGTAKWEPENWLADETPDYYLDARISHPTDWGADFGARYPLIRDAAVFETELPKFVEDHSKDPKGITKRKEPFLDAVAEMALVAYHLHKSKRYSMSASAADGIGAPDWRVACRAWLERRVERAKSRVE